MNIRRHRWHQGVFIAAGLYNIAWGAWTLFDPQWLFRFADMEPLNHPAIFACLGMVIGLYGFLYLEVTRVPQRGWPIAAIGVVGKVLGLLGCSVLVFGGEWPMRTFVMVLTNDLIWLGPFVLYLYDAWPAYRGDDARF